MTAKPAFSLRRDGFGGLTLIDQNGVEHAGVVPVRAYPISAPDAGIALVNQDGTEIGWIDQLAELSAELRQIVEAELEAREFMPEIRAIVDVSSYATPCTWQVETDRGRTRFVLRGEEDMRRLPGDGLLIADNHGIHYLLRDMTTLDKHSRKILDRFL